MGEILRNFRLGRYEEGKNRHLKVTFQNINNMEKVMRNVNELHDEDEFKYRF